MSREYRFLRLNADMEPVEEISLFCLDDKDALTIAGRMGRRIDVWQGDQHISMVLSDASEPPAREPVAAAEPPAIEPKPFNPFRDGVWGRAR
jgi:hypothetical protein